MEYADPVRRVKFSVQPVYGTHPTMDPWEQGRLVVSIMIAIEVTDVRDGERGFNLNAPFISEPYRQPDDFLSELRMHILGTLRHEFDEWFRYKGVLVNDPHR